MALVLAIVLATLAATALAVITVRELGQVIARNEKEKGAFTHWTVDQKVMLVRSLEELGFIEMTSETEALTAGGMDAESVGKAADDLIAAYTGKPASEANFLTIMQVAMGPFEGWTYAEKAWYSQLMREVGLDAYEVRVNFEIPEANEPRDTQAYWAVNFEAPDGMSEQDRLFISFPVYVHPDTGELLWDVEDMLAWREQYKRPDNEIHRAYDALGDEVDAMPFRLWPLDLKARFSQKVAPMIHDMVASGDLSPITLMGAVNTDLLAQASFVYGVPGESNIAQEQALAIAKEALGKAYGLDEAAFALYREGIVYFDITDPDKPLWRFVFSGGSLDWLKAEGGVNNPLSDLVYRAEVDARTGEVVTAEVLPFELAGTWRTGCGGIEGREHNAHFVAARE